MLITTWVPSAFVVLLTVLAMFTLLAFERNTRVVVIKGRYTGADEDDTRE